MTEDGDGHVDDEAPTPIGLRQLGLVNTAEWQKAHPRQIPANHRPDREARPVQEGKQRVVERGVLQRHLVGQDDFRDGLQPCKAESLQSAAHQQHGPRLRAASKGTADQNEENGRLEDCVSAKNIRDLPVERYRRCRS